MTEQQKIYNIKQYRPIDDKDLINDLDFMIKDSHATGYPTNGRKLVDFFIDYGLFTKGYESFDEKSKMIGKTKRIAPHMGFGFKTNTVNKDKPDYALFINMTTLGNEEPLLYREMAEGLEGDTFGYFFRKPNGGFLRPNLDDEKPLKTYYNFDTSLDEYGIQSASLYTYTKELQFFADKEDMGDASIEVCNKGAEFFQNLGLLDSKPHKEDVLELAKSVKMVMCEDNRVAFGFDLKNIEDQDLLITVGRGLKQEKFTSQALEVNVPKPFQRLLLKTGIRFQ